jgi:hypothetical protein
MHYANAALRRYVEESPPTVESGGYSGLPNHFEFAPLDQQLGRLMDAHKESNLNPKSFERLLSSRDWSLTQLSNGGVGLAVVPWDSKIGDTYHHSNVEMIRRFSHTRRDIILGKDVSLAHTLRRTDSTGRRMALVRQWHNPDHWGNLHFLLLLVRIGPQKDLSPDVEVGPFRPIIWFDMSLFEGLNILYANQGRLDSCQDMGLQFGGDIWTKNRAPTLSVEKRDLTLDAPATVLPYKFWEARVAVLK